MTPLLALRALRTWRGADLLLYLLIGGLSVVVDVGSLVLLAEGLDVPLAVATPTSYAAGVVVNFSLNRLLHAGAQPGALRRHAFRYGVLLGANLLVTMLVVLSAEAVGVPYVVAKVAVVAALTGANFVLYRRWVFAD